VQNVVFLGLSTLRWGLQIIYINYTSVYRFHVVLARACVCTQREGQP
jgi:hypothetical protein